MGHQCQLTFGSAGFLCMLYGLRFLRLVNLVFGNFFERRLLGVDMRTAFYDVPSGQLYGRMCSHMGWRGACDVFRASVKSNKKTCCNVWLRLQQGRALKDFIK